MQLPSIYAGYQNDPRGDVIFLAVVIDTNSPGQEAGTAFAETYADQKNFTFPTVPDVNGVIQRYFAENAIPFNMIIDARSMTIKRVFHGGDYERVESEIELILNSE